MDEHTLKATTGLCPKCGYWRNRFGIDKCFCPESECDHSWLDRATPNLVDAKKNPKRPGDVWLGGECLLVMCKCGAILELRSEVFGF